MTFPEIKSLFEQTKANNPAAANLSFEEFARLGARSTGDPEMARIGNASPWENLIRTANQSLNQGIAAITPDETLGEWSGNLAELVGVDRAVGEQVGRSLPRQIANVGAMAVPVVGPALSFGLSAADTYDQTGSLWQTAIAGAAPMVVGKAMNVGGNAVLQAAAKSPTFQKLGVTGGREVIRNLTDDAASFLPIGTKTADLVIDQLPDKLVRFVGGEAVGQATGLALDVAAQGTDAVFNKDYLFANLLGNLAFAPLNITDFVGTKTINTGRTILPPDAGPVRTTSEQRAFEFESLLSSLSPTEKTRAERAAGFDISAQLLGERRLSQINKDFDDGMSQERVLLENDWKMLQEREPLVASVQLEEALADTSKLNVLAPEAKERIERFQLKLKELDAVKKSRMDQMKVVGGTGDLLGVALDELKLPESLLQKSAGERSFEDYKHALDGKVSERGQQVIYSMHQLAAGKREELMAGPHKEVAEEVEKVLQGKGTKFASDRSFVSMALWATGKKPLSDVEVKAKVEKKVKEGNTTKEAVVKVNQKQLAKVRGVDKAPRKKQVQVTERVQAMQALINEAAAAKKPDENQKALVEAYTFANSNPNVSGDEATMRALLSAMSKAWQKYEKPAERLQNFKNQVNKIVENTNKAKRRKELPVEEVKVNADELLDEDLTNDQVRDLDDEVVSELVTEVLGEDESGLQAKQKPVEEASTEELTDGLIERRMYQIAADYFNIPVELAKQRVADLPAAMTRKLWDMAKSQLEMKQAASVASSVPQVGMQKLMSLDQWSDTLLRSEGFSPEEAQQLREHFANAVEMFYSPEVRYGKLGEKQDNLLFARAAAGGGFDFGMAEVKDGKLLRPGKGAVTPRKDGTLSLQEFKVAGGQFGFLQDGEIEFYKQIVPEAFAGDRVNVVQLWDGLQNAGEQVKVVTYGQDGDVSPAKIELDRVNGELDILDYEWQENYVVGFEKDSQGRTTQAILKAETPANIRALVERRNRASDLYKAPAQELPKATSYYNQISPFDTKKFPPVRVDVVLPNYNTSVDNLHTNIKGTVVWAMVQIVPHSRTGKKIAFIAELQSQAAQARRDQMKSLKNSIAQIEERVNRGSLDRAAADKLIQSQKDAADALAPDHPVLSVHQSLGLKAVIKWVKEQNQKAIAEGRPEDVIDEVAISDGETAMMTEGHDKRVNIKGFASKALAEENAPGSWNETVQEKDGTWTLEGVEDLTNQVAFAKLREQGYRIETPQEGGMRLAYDTTMPSIMSKLVGSPMTTLYRYETDWSALPLPEPLKSIVNQTTKPYRTSQLGRGVYYSRNKETWKNYRGDGGRANFPVEQLSVILDNPTLRNRFGISSKEADLASGRTQEKGFSQKSIQSTLKNRIDNELDKIIFKHAQTGPRLLKTVEVAEAEISKQQDYHAAQDDESNVVEFLGDDEVIIRDPNKLQTQGEVRDFGVHKNAWNEGLGGNPAALARMDHIIYEDAIAEGLTHEQAQAKVDAQKALRQPSGSPVFRNSDGTPKTNVTARVYDITAPSERLSSLFARANISQTYAAAATRTRDIFFSPSALKGRNLILQQTSLLTHENSHILFSKARSGAFGPEAQRLTSDFESWAKGLNPHEAETFVDVLSDVWLGKEWKALPGVGDVLKNIRNEKGEMDAEEVMANVFGAYAAGLNKPSNPTKFYTMLPRVVRDMFDWVAKMTQGVVSAARMYGKFGGDVKQVRQAQKVKEVFDAVRRGARNAERNISDLAELANLRQGDVLDKVEVMYAKGKYGSTGSGKWKEKLSYLFDNAIMRMGSLAATYDGLQDPFMKMKDFSPLNADLTAQVFSSLGMGKYGHTGLSVAKDGGWMKIRNSPELHKLASQINLEMQMLNQSLVTRGADGSLQFNTGAMTPELRGKFGMFKPEAQQAVAEYFVRRAEKANPIVQGVIVSKEWETQANKLHELLFESSYADFAGQFEKSKLWSEKVMKMAQNGDDAGVMAEIAALSDPVVQKQIGDYITAQSEKIRFLDAEYKKNPNFGSLRRFQPIKVKWIKAGETAKNMQANSAEEAERMDAELRAQGWTPQSVRITDFKSKGSDVFDSTTKVRVKDMEDRVKLALKEMAVPEEFKAELEKEIDFVGMIERTENAQSVFSTKAQRRFAEGVEDLMVLEQDMLWMSKAIYAANRAALDSNVRVALKNPKLDEYLDAKQTFAQGYENFKTQNHEWLSKLSKANAAYFIGFNIPGHIAELMQPVMTHFAEMRYIGVKTQDALGIMLGASKDLVSFYKRNMKKFAKGEEVHLWDDWQNKDEKDMLFRMKHAINANPLNYAYSDVGFEQQKLIEATETGQKQSLLQAVSSPASAYANTGLKFYGLFTRHNAIMGLLNGYRSYRKIGLSHEEAVQKVGLFETVVNKSGGKADRQAFPFKNNAVLGHLFYGLQGYTTGWVSQLATYYRHGYKSDSYVGFKDNPEAIKRARAAFKTMLGAQFAAAGIMGMPMVGALTTLLEELTGDDIRGEMYEALDTVTNDPLLSQAASHGLSTALAERMGIPADLHGRFAIGGLLGFNAYDGFSASSLFGPTAGVMNSMWNLGKSLYQERDLQKAFSAGGPTGLRSIAKALDEELPLRNENALSTALGFNSAQARKEREFTRIAQKRNEKAAQEISHAARRVQDALALGSSAAQQKLRTEAMKLAEIPEQLNDVIRSIGNKVKLFEEQKTFPKDIREVATPQTTAGLSQLAKAMGVRLPASQEVEREMLKQEVMRRMGMSPASQMRQAMVEDYSAASDPWQLR